MMTIDVPAWEWVEVQRPIVDKGQACGIDFGGTVTVLGYSGDLALVTYHRAGAAKGTQCSDGVVFFLPVKELDTFSERTAQRRDNQAKTESEVARIIGERK